MMSGAINVIFCQKTYFEDKIFPEILKIFREKKDYELTGMFSQHWLLEKSILFYCCYSKRNNNRKNLI